MIRKQLGWQPSIRLRDGMEKTYRWIYDEMRGSADARRAVFRA
jgi:dTDP-D-glucose 4,6-dehydratase